MYRKPIIFIFAIVAIVTLIQLSNFSMADPGGVPRTDRSGIDQANLNSAVELIEQGKQIFRYDTFGDEAFWGG